MSEKDFSPNQRLMDFLVQQESTIYAFSIKTDISKPVCYGIKNNRSPINMDSLQKILRAYRRLNPIWLILGEGEMLVNPEQSKEDRVVIKKLEEKVAQQDRVIDKLLSM